MDFSLAPPLMQAPTAPLPEHIPQRMPYSSLPYPLVPLVPGGDQALLLSVAPEWRHRACIFFKCLRKI